MLRKLLFYKSSPLQLILSIVGTFAGLTLLLCSLQFSQSLQTLLNSESDLIGSQYLVIQKEISVFNSLALSDSKFADHEIENLKAVSGIVDIAPFVSNRFAAHLYTDERAGDMVPHIYSDIFFEAVPDDFLDIQDVNWKWSEGDSVVPVVLPKEYLNLYNFGFAPGQSMPQLTPSMLRMLDFNIRIDGNQSSIVYHAFIAGFSSRIHSILVPLSFLNNANARFGPTGHQQPSRLILKTEHTSSPIISNYLKSNGYETNEESLRSGKLNGIVQTMLAALMILGSLIISLAFLSLIQNAQLLVAKSEYEIRTCILMGYSPRVIVMKYFSFYALLICAVTLLSFVTLYFLHSSYLSYMHEHGYEPHNGIFRAVYVWMGALLIGIMVMSYLSFKSTIARAV